MSILAKKTKTSRKNAKNNNLLKTKRIIYIKMSAKGGGPVFTFVLPGVKDRTTAPPSRQLQHCKQVVHAEEMDRLKL